MRLSRESVNMCTRSNQLDHKLTLSARQFEWAVEEEWDEAGPVIISRDHNNRNVAAINARGSSSPTQSMPDEM